MDVNTFNFDDADGILRTISHEPPTHYIVQIESLSLLTKHSSEKYESGDFEAGGHKWKLVFYPNGNKNKNVKEHLSLYLVMSGANATQFLWEVYAVFRLFLLDQDSGNYLVLQEQKERRFHAKKPAWGFDQFLSHKAFTDAANGFLIDDDCVFGAEVFVTKERSTGRRERLSMIKDAVMSKETWRIDNFSKIGAEVHESKTFIVGGQKWKIQVYPKGKVRGLGSHLSLYLALADPKSLPPGSKIYAAFTLRINDQTPHCDHKYANANYWFTASNSEWGWLKFMTLATFKSEGYLVEDTCFVEAEVTVHGIANAFYHAI